MGTSRVFGKRISVGQGHKASFSGSVKHAFTFIEDRDFIYRYLEEKTYNKNRSFDIAFIRTIKEEPVINGVKHAKEKR